MPEIRELTEAELELVKKLDPDDFVIICGQDHTWYLYSNTLDSYMSTEISTSDMDEDEISVILYHRIYENPNFVWYFGDNFDI